LDRLGVIGCHSASISWPRGESFRGLLDERLGYGDQKKGGRPPWCPVLMLKVLILQRFSDLSDEGTEFQIMDRFSFLRFLGLRPGDGGYDHATIRAFKERLGEDGMLAVFEQFNDQLRAHGLMASCGKITDASFVGAPKQRNNREQNARIKAAERPEDFDQNPRRGSQKDTDARWTKKDYRFYYGYKNHVKVDAASKFIATFTVTHAAVHDSQPVEQLLRERGHESVLWADSAYLGRTMAGCLERFGVLANVCEKGTSVRPLDAQQKQTSRQKSRVRARVEHIFGRISQFGGNRFRRMGHRRCCFETALTNLTYNLDRFAMFHGKA